MLQLNAKNVFISDKKRVESWRVLLKEALEKVNAKRNMNNKSIQEIQDEELIFTDKCMVGCYVAVFFRKRISKRIPE